VLSAPPMTLQPCAAGALEVETDAAVAADHVPFFFSAAADHRLVGAGAQENPGVVGDRFSLEVEADPIVLGDEAVRFVDHVDAVRGPVDCQAFDFHGV
jgi:hypothetical protein